MKTKTIKMLHKQPYVRGPHVRYFIMAMSISLLITLALFAVLIVIMRLID